MKSSLRGTLLRVAISLGLMAAILFFMRDKIGEAWHIIKTDVKWEWIGIAFIGFIIANGILSVRMKVAFAVQKINLHFKDSFYLSFLGLFFNLFLPSAVGGDVAKIYYAYKHTGKKVESASAILQDRLVGFIAIMCMAMVALLFLRGSIEDPRINILVYIFVGIMVFTICFFGSKRFAGIFSFGKVFIPKKLTEKLSSLYHAIHQFRNRLDLILLIILLSFIGQVGFVTVHYWVAVSLGADISYWVFFLVIPVVAIVSMFPSLGGLGVREAGLILFLKHYMPSERALVLSLLLDMLIYATSFGAGIIYAIKGGLGSKALHEMEEMGQNG